MQVLVITNKDGIKINADGNAKNLLRKEYVTKDLNKTLAVVNVNVINNAILKNILMIKTVSVEKG